MQWHQKNTIGANYTDKDAAALLIDIEAGTGAYLVLVSKTIAVTRVEDSIGPKCLGTWVSDVTQHGNVGFGADVTY